MASTPVKLYIYDISNGLARQMSMMLTGRQMDGIWHTSVVAFNMEIFYGQGIRITSPGGSPHGAPLRIVDIGETEIDEQTFTEYLSEMRYEYTAEKYHLLDFNCNTFSNACIGFLTGGSIPDYITSLPSDFLSTPFGAAFRPTIDSMYGARSQSGLLTPPPDIGAATVASPNPAFATSLLQAISTQAASGSTAPGPSPRAYLPTPQPTSPPTPSPDEPTNYSNDPNAFYSLLASNRATVAFFTSATCGPCRAIAPVFAELEKSKGRPNDIAFGKVDLTIGMGSALAEVFGVRVTPTFLFFLGPNKVHELRGSNAPELRTQVDLLIYRAFPPHPHVSVALPVMDSLRLDPILFSQLPNLDIMFSKLAGFIDAVPSWTGSVTQAQAKQILTKTVLPFLKTTGSGKTPLSFDHWPALTSSIASNLATSQLFPIVDIWRLALLNPKFSVWCSTTTTGATGDAAPIKMLVDKALHDPSGPVHRNYLLTVLRMLCNVFASADLAREMLACMRGDITGLLVTALWHEDAHVRTAAASLAFNVSAYLQKLRVDKFGPLGNTNADTANAVAQEEDGDWEVEMVSALLEAIKRETSEEIVHRLAASLGLLLRLSPFTEQMTGLLDVLQARRVLQGKLDIGGCGEGRVEKDEVRRVVLEVSIKLCP